MHMLLCNIIYLDLFHVTSCKICTHLKYHCVRTYVVRKGCVPARGYFFTYVRTAMGLYFTPTQAYVPILTTYEVRTPVRTAYVPD